MIVDIVIPVYGQWDVVERCLDSLRVRDACIGDIIVVDDASPDDAAQQLRARTDVRAVLLPANRGFSGACNAGAAVATAEAILFLNSDTIVLPGSIDVLAATLAADETLGAVGPRLLYADGTLQSAGLALTPGLAGVGRAYIYLDGDLPQANIARDDITLTGAAFLIRRALFEDIGGFDESYRTGWEDIELGVQIWRRGRRCRYVPAATLVHLEGATRGKTIADDVNGAHFRSRWAGMLDPVPRYAPPGEPPALALAWRDATPVDGLARTNLFDALTAYGGARVMRASDPARLAVARALAAGDGRSLLRVAYGPARGADVRWFAPHDAAEAGALAADAGAAVWVPSRRARDLIVAAGFEAARVRVTRLGFRPLPEAAPTLGAVIVTTRDVRPSLVDALRRALEGDVRTIDAETCREQGCALVRSATIVVFASAGDPWGVLGGNALAAGAVVVAPADAPFLEVMPADAFVGVPAAANLVEAAAEVRAQPLRYAALGRRARREMQRRLPDVYAGHRIRELGRALVHGVVDPGTFAIGAEVAATLQR